MFYLTNFANFVHERSFILVIPVTRAVTFLIPKLEETHVRIWSIAPLDYVPYFEFPALVGQIGLETLLRMAILSLLRLSARLQYQQSLSAIIGYVALLMVFERSSRTSKLVE